MLPLSKESGDKKTQHRKSECRSPWQKKLLVLGSLMWLWQEVFFFFSVSMTTRTLVGCYFRLLNEILVAAQIFICTINCMKLGLLPTGILSKSNCKEYLSSVKKKKNPKLGIALQSSVWLKQRTRGQA